MPGGNGFIVGGGGGGGGAHGYVGAAPSILSAQGGAGGAGGASLQPSVPGGGGGGAGGWGAVITGPAASSFTTTSVIGGNGGGGGTGSGGPGGNGGSGGIGLYVEAGASGATITNNGLIAGGDGGSGAAVGGISGLGGISLIGAGLTIDNTGGSITGGTGRANAFGSTQNFAVQFAGGTNIASYTGTYTGGMNVAGGSFAPALTGSVVGTTLNVGGPMVFAAGTSFNIRITPTANDSVTSTTANLGGAAVNVAAGAGTYVIRQYTILTATAGFGATRFGAVTSNFAFLTPTLSYDVTNNNVFLNIQAGTAGAPAIAGIPDYRSAALTANQYNFATGLVLGGLTSGGNNPILTGFNQLTAPQAQAAFDSLTGEGITGAQNTAFTASRLFTSSIADQILLFGSAPNSVIVPTTPSTAPLAYNAVQALPTPIRVRDPILSRPMYSWRAWGAGYGASQTINANAVPGNARQNIGIGGGSVGVDYTYAPGMLSGIALGGSDGSFNVGARQTSGSTTGGHAAFYTLAEFGNIYAASINSVSVFGNRTTRTVAGFGGLNSEILRGNFTSTEFRTRVEFGYRFTMAPGVTLTPFYAVEAAKLRSDGFNETAIAGAGLFALNVRGQTASSVPMFFGARLAGAIDIGNGMTLRPSVQAAFVAEFAPVRNQVAALVNLPGATFLTDGARPSRSSAQVKAGAEMAVLDNVAVSANFDGEFSNRSNTYAGKGAIKVRW